MEIPSFTMQIDKATRSSPLPIEFNDLLMKCMVLVVSDERFFFIFFCFVFLCASVLNILPPEI